MNLGDPELEIIDPTPNVHALFLQFDKLFFWTKLASRAVVRWSKRMYSCAGICSYEGRGGLCDIALSEPLLKLRPRKNLVETLLHEMIHAYLFVTGNDRDRDGHGPNFQSHMHRINKAASVNISIYHDFHDEVKLYQTHVWRCDGPCQKMKPYFGIYRSTCNRAPGPSFFWWDRHKRKCGGNFIKIKEPDKPTKKKDKKKPMGDITKFVNNNNKTCNDKTCKNKCPDTSSSGHIINSPASKTIPVFTGAGKTLTEKATKLSVDNVAETVRNVWAKKTAVVNNSETIEDISKKVKEVWANKNFDTDKSKNVGKARAPKRTSLPPKTPPVKVKKIDDYFKKEATKTLSEIYGTDFDLVQSKSDNKMIAVPVKSEVKTDLVLDVVSCPICSLSVSKTDINEHIDECLNLEEIKRIANDAEINSEPSTSKTNIVIKTEVNDNLSSDEDSSELQDPKDEVIDINIQKCPCCQVLTDKPMDQHLEECLAFFNTTEGPSEPSTSYSDAPTIVIEDDDDDVLDESQTFNATGTKSPCPVCLKMFEQANMNEHLDQCLS